MLLLLEIGEFLRYRFKKKRERKRILSRKDFLSCFLYIFYYFILSYYYIHILLSFFLIFDMLTFQSILECVTLF